MVGTQSGMSVLVTGGTGFIGLHTALALHEAGHAVCLLVRDPGKMQRVYGPFGLDGLETIVGDITDGRAVNRALAGRDAVVHSAAAVNVYAKDAARTMDTNLRGTERVIGGACDRGIGRILQVSSLTALFSRSRGKIDENTPPGTSTLSYGRSKIACDRYVRRLQDSGAPVHTTYPGSVIGPHDPGMSEAMLGLKVCLEDLLVVTSTGIQLIDVRDLALAHVRILEKGGPPERYVMGGQYFPWGEYGRLLEQIIGRRLRKVHALSIALQGLGWWADWASRFIPMDIPISREALVYASEWRVADDRKALRELDLCYRDIRDTLTDTILWMHDAGRLRRSDTAAGLVEARARRRAGA